MQIRCMLFSRVTRKIIFLWAEVLKGKLFSGRVWLNQDIAGIYVMLQPIQKQLLLDNQQAITASSVFNPGEQSTVHVPVSGPHLA